MRFCSSLIVPITAVCVTLFLTKASVAGQNTPIHYSPELINTFLFVQESEFTGNNINLTDAQTNTNLTILNDRLRMVDAELLDPLDREAVTKMREGNLQQARAIVSRAIDNSDFTGDVRKFVNRQIIRAAIDEQVGAYIGALQDLQFAFRLAANTNHADLVADIAYIIASIHQSRNEHGIALSYARLALDTYEGINDRPPAQVLLLSISSLLATRQLEDASILLKKVAPILAAADIAPRANDAEFSALLKRHRAKYFTYLGQVELYNDNIEESIVALDVALNLTQTDAKQSLATLHLLLSQAYTAKDNMDEAIDYLVKAFNQTKNVKNPFYLNQALQLHRANLLSQLNDFEAAYRVTQDLLKERELNQPIAEIKRMLDMHANFQLNMQQQENAELKQENQWKTEQIETKQILNRLYFLIIGLLFCTCCLLLLVFIRGKKHRLSLEKIAHTDALTGLNSRTRVLELLTHHQNLFNRNGQEYCVAIVDLDFFKKINDNYGHQTGDSVLKSFGELSQSSFRKTDILGRIGGEEFLFILPQTKREQALEVLNQFNDKLPMISTQLDLAQTTTASIGVACPLHAEEPMNIIKRADAALYEAKDQGRNCVIIANKVVSLQNSRTEVN